MFLMHQQDIQYQDIEIYYYQYEACIPVFCNLYIKSNYDHNVYHKDSSIVGMFLVGLWKELQL